MARCGLVKSFACLLTLQAVLASPIQNTAACGTNPSPVPIPREGAVASESDICSHIGTELLKQGGNAADAMVGTVACVGVVGMYHSGKSHSVDKRTQMLINTRSRWRWLYACSVTKRYLRVH
jgi:hypothetical protein